jgi:hypothetical protein
MNKPSILKSVSISEMLHMRDAGLSNAEIADKIGCSYVTVNRHIGKAPFRKSRDDNHKAKPLPPVGDKPIIEIPHKSFAERLAESYKKPVSIGTVKIPEKVKEDIERKFENGVVTQQPLLIPAGEKPRTLADLAREAHERKMAEMATADTEDRTHIPELIAMFGPDAVTAWLKVSLYNMGIPDCRPMSRKKMLEMLKIMNAGGASV